MKEILFFTHNRNKVIEVKQILKTNKINLQKLDNFSDVVEPKETGNTFSENAKIKSRYGQKISNIPCFADDSGFCVEALNDGPGIRSKRFLEKFSSNIQAFEHIIRKATKENNYRAYFVTAICLTLKKNHHINFIGKIKGRISLKPKGNNGFGYDPIFIPRNYKKTFAEMNTKEKSEISHRKIALTKLKSFLF